MLTGRQAFQRKTVTGAKYQISTGHSPLWSSDGKEVVYSRGPQLVAIRVTTPPTFAFGNPIPVPSGGLEVQRGLDLIVTRRFDMTPDGRIVGVVDSAQTLSGAPTTPQIQVVLNWFEELKQRVPVP